MLVERASPRLVVRRGFTFEKIDLYRSQATKFTVTEKGLLPPFTSLPGLGETAACDIVNERTKGEFISAEDVSLRCPKATKAVIELLETHGTLDMLPKNSQLSLFG
jgi:DNA polymerase-3 subunit alpha (Gram-positive type)